MYGMGIDGFKKDKQDVGCVCAFSDHLTSLLWLITAVGALVVFLFQEKVGPGTLAHTKP